MKVALNSISINKKNPRRISDKQMRKLVLSILTFPSMLDIRWIVVNSECVALGGNQRLAALKEIAGYKEDVLLNVLMQSKKFCSLSDSDQDALVGSWLSWIKEPSVEVRQVECSSEEQDEFMLKDNASFGEFDYSKLGEMYSEEMLVDMGFEEDCFYNSDQDEGALVVVEGSAPRRIDTIKFGEYSCEISQEEYKKLESLFQGFVEASGTAYGFITSIRNGVYCNQPN